MTPIPEALEGACFCFMMPVILSKCHQLLCSHLGTGCLNCLYPFSEGSLFLQILGGENDSQCKNEFFRC